MHLSQTLLLPDDVLVLLILGLAVLPLAVHDRGVHVGRGEGVGLVEQGDDAQEDGAHVLRRVPPLRGELTALRVVHRRVKDRDAYFSVLLGEKHAGYNTSNATVTYLLGVRN